MEVFGGTTGAAFLSGSSPNLLSSRLLGRITLQLKKIVIPHTQFYSLSCRCNDQDTLERTQVDRSCLLPV
jgi:hypothetical protein